MADPADAPGLTIAVLAAGQSHRFGDADKLCADFRGTLLGQCAVETLAQSELHLAAQHRIVVTSDLRHACAIAWREAGFDPVLNPNAASGMGTSVALAARIARRAGSMHLLIALADMPLVPAPHFEALVASAQTLRSAARVASSNGSTLMPPAVFGSDCFASLSELEGDAGARALLSGSNSLACPRDWLSDVDTPEALALLQNKP